MTYISTPSDQGVLGVPLRENTGQKAKLSDCIQPGNTVCWTFGHHGVDLTKPSGWILKFTIKTIVSFFQFIFDFYMHYTYICKSKLYEKYI